MTELLGGFDERLREPHRADEVAALELADDRVAVAAPALDGSETGFDLLVAEQQSSIL